MIAGAHVIVRETTSHFTQFNPLTPLTHLIRAIHTNECGGRLPIMSRVVVPTPVRHDRRSHRKSTIIMVISSFNMPIVLGDFKP